ncbi:uncharacterized protein LOC126909497 [Daktulosphaira vitifoliae]|uniref:uncharacterized protein LOC126909497 n=1 Tax=Daktulosphaira vitifoliae TaxID=58002 RepID=UPI0021A9DA0A|nr:uncharacterized protein LOC126909497 [Daktulosphaira vitifoliae]
MKVLIFTILYFACFQLTLQLICDPKTFVKTITQKPRWESFSNIKVMFQENQSKNLCYHHTEFIKNPTSYQDYINLRVKITAQHVCSIISCKYTYVLLTYVTLIEHLANEYKILLNNDNRNIDFKSLYNIIKNIERDTEFIKEGIDFGYLLKNKYFTESFLTTPLKNLYRNFNEIDISINEKSLLLFMKHENIINLMIESLKTFKEEIYENVIGKFCDNQDPPVPNLESLRNEHANRVHTETFESFLTRKTLHYPFDSQVKYFSQLGFSLGSKRLDIIAAELPIRPKKAIAASPKKGSFSNH